MSLNSKIVSTYSKSIFQTIKASSSTTTDVFIIGEELSLLRSTLTTSKKLKAFFDNPIYAENQKLEVLSSIFPGLTVTMKSFLKVLKERNHLNLIPQISDSYTDLLLEFKNTTVVKVITANTLQESYGKQLLETLKKITNAKEVLLEVSYDPRLLGGVIIEYKSSAIDASILKEFSLFFNEG